MHDQLTYCVSMHHVYGKIVYEISQSIPISHAWISFLGSVCECVRVCGECVCMFVSGELTNWKTIAKFSSFMCFTKHDMNFILQSFSISVDSNTLLAISWNPRTEEKKNYDQLNNRPFYYRTQHIQYIQRNNTHIANWIGFSWIENDETQNFKISPFLCTLTGISLFYIFHSNSSSSFQF